MSITQITREKTMEAPVSNLNAKDYMLNRYVLDNGGFYDKIMLHDLVAIDSYRNEEDVYSSPENTERYFKLLLELYVHALNGIISVTSNCKISLQNNIHANFKMYVGMLIDRKALLDPSVKLFLVDLHRILYSTDNNSSQMLNHGYILGKPLKDFRRTSIMTYSDLKTYQPVVGKSDIVTLLQKLGLAGTLDVVKLLVAVYISMIVELDLGMLNKFLPKLTTFRRNGFQNPVSLAEDRN